MRLRARGKHRKASKRELRRRSRKLSRYLGVKVSLS